MPPLPRWSVDELEPSARSVSASRRTDIPALFAPWMRRRLQEGEVEYIPAGPPRRVRRSLRPEHVTHLNFWTKWPRPFLPVLDELLEAGWPTLWNVTLTGLGGTPLEPDVPSPDRVLGATRTLARRVGREAVLWRFDPLLLSDALPPESYLERFRALAGPLAGSVDRVATSFVTEYGRRVKPDLRRYFEETGSSPRESSPDVRQELVLGLAAIAREHGMELTLCCSPELREATKLSPTGCNSWDWARRVYPQLESFRGLRAAPCREDCACSLEFDIGCYDTCILGCRYSYGSCNQTRARDNQLRHDPEHPCLIPP